MKFKKLSLDESLFDDDTSLLGSTSAQPSLEKYIQDKKTTQMDPFHDDDFSAPEYMPEMDGPNQAPAGPAEGSDTGVADLIISAINDEWEAIQKYNSIVATLRSESARNTEYERFISVIEDINNEENKHVGQLQELLKVISPNAKSIRSGEIEGATQLKTVSPVRLQVQSWEDKTPSTMSATSFMSDDVCNLNDVDDEM